MINEILFDVRSEVSVISIYDLIPNTKSMIKNFFRLPQKGQDAINALLKIEHIDEQTFRRTVADLEFIADKLNEGASPGPLVAVSENKTLGELSKEKGNI